MPRFSGWDVYGNIFFPGGLLASGLLRNWSRLNAALDHDALNDVFGWKAGLLTSGVRPVDDDLLDEAIAARADHVDVVDLFGPLVYRDDTDPRGSDVSMDDFSPHLLGDASAPDVAIYSYGGWFDGAHPRGQVRRYVSRGYRGDRLLLGPWFHGGDFNASPYATGGRGYDHAGEVLRFFDYHLRRIDDVFTSDDPVRYYTMGAEVWNASRTWPPPGVSWQSYSLAPDGRLSGDRSGLESASDRYKVDETLGTGSGSRWGVVVVSGAKRGYPDRRDIDRSLLTYTSPPLESDLEVTGHPIARLHVSANATDGALFVYLEDVHPDGKVRTGPVEADGAVDAQNAPTAPWKTLCVFHELPQGLSHQVTHEKLRKAPKYRWETRIDPEIPPTTGAAPDTPDTPAGSRIGARIRPHLGDTPPQARTLHLGVT